MHTSKKTIVGVVSFAVVGAVLGLRLHAQGPAKEEISLKGAIDFHVHSAPDSQTRVIDADDLARLAKSSGMRGMVFKNHHESTASVAYLVRKEVPGIEIFGGMTMDLSNGGINMEAVENMVNVTGHYGRVIWLPTQDAENDWKQRKGGPHETPTFVPVTKDGKVVPAVLTLMDYIAKHPQIVFATGHISAEENLIVIHEAHQRGIKKIVATHPMYSLTHMSVAQMKQAVADGAFIEFVADSTVSGPQPRVTFKDMADAIKEIGAKYCLLSTNSGAVRNPPAPLHPAAMLEFMTKLHEQGISVADIDLMAKTTPALLLDLKP